MAKKTRWLRGFAATMLASSVIIGIVVSTADACTTKDYVASVCARPNQKSGLCNLAKAESICRPGERPGGTKVSGTCLVGSCIAPKGKTADEWLAMSEAQRQTLILTLPKADLNAFSRALDRQSRH